MTAHKHAALMLQYAQDAAETDTPWERWEFEVKSGVWCNLSEHPAWLEHKEYRRKPQVIRVGRHEFLKPIAFTPPKDTIQWVIRLSAEGYAPDDMIWTGDKTDFDLLKSCVVHLSREAAQAHADVLNAICRGDID